MLVGVRATAAAAAVVLLGAGAVGGRAVAGGPSSATRPVGQHLHGDAVDVATERAVARAAAALARQQAPGAGVSGDIVVAGGGANTGYATRLVVVSQGSGVDLVNLDGIPHTVNSVALGRDGRPLFSASALGGGTVAHVRGVEQLAPGSYPFACSFHPNMQGTLVVQGSGGGTRPTPPTFPLPLRIPRVVDGARITIPVVEAGVRVLPGQPPTQMFTYGGSFPGPTIRLHAGRTTRVTFVNRLPATWGSISVHHHGGHQRSADDGQPDSELIAPGAARTYTYAPREAGAPQHGAFDFYHDHRMDVTGRNVWNGLQGMVEVDDPREARLHLPSGAQDVPLDITDRALDSGAQLTEPFPKPGEPASATGASSPPGDATVGDRVLVNGEFAPHLDVQPRRYRLRLLNGSSFQSYELALSDGTPFVQVGNGSALLTQPVTRGSLLLGPAERADVVVDFARLRGRSVVLRSVPRSDGSPVGIGTPDAPLLQFRVGRRAVRDTSRVPASLVALAPLAVPAQPTQVLDFGLGADPSGLAWTVNGRRFDPARADIAVPLGTVQRWTLLNTSSITHYVHLHEMAWRTVSRDGGPPPPWEAGLQDTWRLDPGESVDVAARMTDYTGRFMIHCHMLDHEDHGMMTQFEVVPAGSAHTTGRVR